MPELEQTIIAERYSSFTIKSKREANARNLGTDCVTKRVCPEGKESCGRINTILKMTGESNE